MSTSKELTAKVTLDVKDAESKLERLEKLIKSINKAVTGHSNTSQLESKLAKQVILYEKAAQQAEKTKLAQQKLVTETNRTHLQQRKVTTESAKTAFQLQKIQTEVAKTKLAQKQLNASTEAWDKKINNAKSAFGGVWKFVKRIAGTLLTMQSFKLAVQGADALTGAENRFNNIAVQQMGDSAYAKDSSNNITGYSQKALDFSKNTMDKIYVAAQNSRGEYATMLQGVSKTMTLAGKAFGGNVDNAIRFEEIMSKAFTISGASAEEMSTSMYQLRQALASGRLAGDEMKSVMENAPMAYQKIEAYVQKIFEGTEYAGMALKDLGSKGVVTSDMIIAAILDSGEAIDQQFALTKWRFSELWNSIKSSAQRAFAPVVTILSDMLNKAIDNGMIEKCTQVFITIAKMILIIFQLTMWLATGIAEIWDWLKHVLILGLITYAAYLVVTAIIAIKASIAKIKQMYAEHVVMMRTVGIIGIIIFALYELWDVWNQWTSGAISGCEALLRALTIILAAIGLAMLSFGNMWGFALLAGAAVLGILSTMFKDPVNVDVKGKTGLDKIGNALGLDFSGFDSLPTDITHSLKTDEPEDLLKDIALDVGEMSDTMKLTDDERDLYRKIAEMEWRKEFTTAEIKIDMTNYNSVNGERDLDGMVEYLRDVLHEEMNVVANGVH